MPTTVIPLALVPSQRGSSTLTTIAKDQLAQNAITKTVSNAITKEMSLYVEKRLGIENGTTISGTDTGYGVFIGRINGTRIQSFGTSIFGDSSNLGSITGSSGIQPGGLTSGILSSKEYFFINEGSGNAFYWVSDASVTTVTGDTTNLSAVVTNVSSTTGLYSGQPVSGTGIPASTRILTVDSATQFTMNANATATNAGVSITVTRLAKILDADFPTDNVGGFAMMDGYAFVMTLSGRIYNSNLNEPHLYSAQDYISLNQNPTRGRTVITRGGVLIGFGIVSTEFYVNAGNASGSPLQRRQELSLRMGTASNVIVDNDIIYWVGISGNSYAGIFAMPQFAPEKISTPEVDSYFQVYARISSSVGIFCSTISYGGRSFLLCSSSSQTTRVWAYCIQERRWEYWIVPTATQGFRYAVNDTFGGNLVYINGNDGKQYSINPAATTYTDAGSTMTFNLRTDPKVLNNGLGFTIKKIHLLADNQSSGTTTLGLSIDDYTNITTLGTFDLTQTKKTVHGGGFCPVHAIFQLTDTNNVAWRGQALVVEWEPGVT